MKPESVSPVIDQESPSLQLAAGESTAKENPARNEEASRCAFRYANRRRCRLPITTLSAPFCPQHSVFHPDDPDSINLAPALLGSLTELTSAVHMQTTLSKLFVLLAQNRISNKKAAVLTYIIQQLLQTLPAVYYETHDDEDDDKVTIIMNAPRPIRD